MKCGTLSSGLPFSATSPWSNRSIFPPEIQQTPALPTVTQIPVTWEEFKRFKQQARDAAVLDLERRFLTQALRHSDGNVSRAAEMVGMQRTNFHALMRKCDLSVEDYR